jgi:hypothetical protein
VTSPHRRSNYDVTDTVQVSSPAAVREAVLELYATTWPGAELDTLGRAVDDFGRLFTGKMPGYVGVDTRSTWCVPRPGCWPATSAASRREHGSVPSAP